MKRPDALARTAVVVALTACGAFCRGEAQADAWRDRLPAQCLAVVVVEDLAALERNAARALEPWGLDTTAAQNALWADAATARFAARPWVFALAEEGESVVSPLLLAPIDDFDRFCESVSAQRLENLSVARIAGQDCALADRQGWAEVRLLADARLLQREPTNRPPSLASVGGDAWASLSQRGARLLADRARGVHDRNLRRNRGRLRPPVGWPRDASEWRTLLAMHHHVLAAIADLGGDVGLGLEFDATADELVLRLTLPPDGPRADLPNIATTPPADRDAIAYLRFDGGVTDTVASLLLAVWRSRPDEVEASEYAGDEWRLFAESTRALLAQIDAGDVSLAHPGDGQALLANQSARFTPREQQSFDRTLRLTVARWNALVDASQAGTPLRVELTPLDAGVGWSVSVDFVSAFGVSPDDATVVDLLSRLFGEGGRLTFRIVKDAADAWSIRPRGAEATPRATAQRAQPDEDATATGYLRLDRLITWQRLVDDAQNADTLGRRVRPPMEEAPPATLRVVNDTSLRFEARLPAVTNRAAAAYWRAEKQPSD